MRVRKNEERYSDNLNIRMKPSVKSLIKAKAEERGMTVSELVESSILKELAFDKKESN